MIKIPFLTVIIFFILCCVYHMQYSNALERGSPIKIITTEAPTEVPIEVSIEAPEPISYHKKQFSLFYRKKIRKSL